MNLSSTTYPQIQYRVVTTRNPRTGGTILRPVVAERRHYDTEALVDYALKTGFVFGHACGIRGTLEGLLGAIRELVRGGSDVMLDGFLRVHGELGGTVGEDGRITDENVYRVNINALKEMQVEAKHFGWKRVKD